MKFGPLPVVDAEGAILAHSLTLGTRRIRKAHRLTADDIADLKAAGVTTVVVAVEEPGDIAEDDAAVALVAAMHYEAILAKPPATGRVNLHAQATGVFTVDAGLIDAINAVDPAITVATLAQHATVETGQMVATVKIIPYAVAAETLARVTALCRSRRVFAVHPFRPTKVGVIQTLLPSVKASVLDKTVTVTRQRLARSGSQLMSEQRVPHESSAVAQVAARLAADYDLVLIFGASAVSDFDDVIPAAIRAADGIVTRTGMPVDPGNLLVLGRIGATPVIGAPGCARSPKENGFDWVLDRTLAGLEVTDRDIAGMGVGGLLMEIASRPQPRDTQTRPARIKVQAVILAAGRSSRMGGPNKLMAAFDGKPLVRRVVERALESTADGVCVVTGHQADRVRDAIDGLGAATVHNDAFACGLSSSLKAGLAALLEDVQGALIVLGDMPGVTSADLDRLITAFRESEGRAIIRATHNGKRGNPVILPRSLFAAVSALEGDAGARHLVEAEGAEVVDVELGASASVDVDTPQAMASAGGVLQE